MIITRLSGGMGNQMFQYAIGRKLSLKYKVPLKLDTTFLLQRISFPALLRPHFVFRNYDLDVYNIKADIAANVDMKWWQRPILSGKVMLFIDAVLRKIPFLKGWETSYQFESHILDIGPDAYLAGFWQSYKYFDDIKDTLKEDFAIIAPLPADTNELMEEINAIKSVALHVRRLDMAEKSMHGAVDVAYYEKAVRYISEHDSIDRLYVFSDDIEWCKKNLVFSQPITYVEHMHSGKKGEGHIALMSNCRHIVIPNSTFSWWAAWLGNKEGRMVIAPSQWFQGTSLNTIDLIPSTWIRL
ncbi:MAG: alpha-1,2-fucosyltransferase [Patescibacteria group bacterium]